MNKSKAKLHSNTIKTERKNIRPSQLPQNKYAAGFTRHRKKIDYFLFISIAVLFMFSCLMPFKVRHYPSYVDWQIISFLSGLFIITTGLELSDFFYLISKKLIKRVRYENTLAFLLIAMAAVFSMFLTNDISILIVVPLTLSLSSIIRNDIHRLVILEIIAVNTGSLLSPIGNPQNIYIWHKWHIPFFKFILHMLPLFIILFLLLLLLTHLISKNVPLIFHNNSNNIKTDKKLLITSSVSFIAFIAAEELKITLYLLPVIIGMYLIFFKDVLKKTNWSLVALFIVLFIDVKILSGLNTINSLMNSLKLSRTANLYFSGILLSQIISNVPATFLLADFNVNPSVLVYSVNIGSAGIVTGSLANLIALRLVNTKKIFIQFHIYSFIFLILATGIGFLILLIFQSI